MGRMWATATGPRLALVLGYLLLKLLLPARLTRKYLCKFEPRPRLASPRGVSSSSRRNEDSTSSLRMHWAMLAFSNPQLELSFHKQFALLRIPVDKGLSIMAATYTFFFALSFHRKLGAALASAAAAAAPPGLRSASGPAAEAAVCSAGSIAAWSATSDSWHLVQKVVLWECIVLAGIRGCYIVLVWLWPGRHLSLRRALALVEWAGCVPLLVLLRASSCAPHAPGPPSFGKCFWTIAAAAMAMGFTVAVTHQPLAVSLPCFLVNWLVATTLSWALYPAIGWYVSFLELLAGVVLPWAVLYVLERPSRQHFLAQEAGAAAASASGAAAAEGHSKLKGQKPRGQEQQQYLPLAERPASAPLVCAVTTSSGSRSSSSGAPHSLAVPGELVIPPPPPATLAAAQAEVDQAKAALGSGSMPRQATATSAAQVQAVGRLRQQDAPISAYRSRLKHMRFAVKVVPREQQAAPAPAGPAGSMTTTSSGSSPSSNSGTAPAVAAAMQLVQVEEVRAQVTQAVRSSLSVQGFGNQIIRCSCFQGCIRLLFEVAVAPVAGGEGGMAADNPAAAAAAVAVMPVLLDHAAAAMGAGGHMVQELQMVEVGAPGGHGNAWAAADAAHWAAELMPEPPVLCVPYASSRGRSIRDQQQLHEEGGEEEAVSLAIVLSLDLCQELLDTGNGLRVVVSDTGSAALMHFLSSVGLQDSFSSSCRQHPNVPSSSCSFTCPGSCLGGW